MKKAISIFIILILAGKLHAQQGMETDQIIIKFKKEVKLGQQPGGYFLTSTGSVPVDRVNDFYHSKKIRKITLGRKTGSEAYVVKFPEGTDLGNVIRDYLSTGEVEYAVPDPVGKSLGVKGWTPDDLHFGMQWALKNDGSFSLVPSVAGADIDMENAWEIHKGSDEIVIAVIDAGITPDHPEFAGRLWVNEREIEGNEIDDDGNGFVDDIHGWNFAYGNNDITDDNGHGTHVTGVLGANGNNGIGYSGMDLNCRIMPLKGINMWGVGYYSYWIEAIYYAVDHGANVINMSLGGYTSLDLLQDAILYAVDHNVTVVAAMGNDNVHLNFYPAACTGVIAVGATTASDKRANPFYPFPTLGSNYGNHISVVAPGDVIYGLDASNVNNYDFYYSGTSQAAPHVTALVSLLLAQNPDRSPAEIKRIIEETAEDGTGDPGEDTPGWDMYYGHGRINAYKALTYTTNALSQHELPDYSVYPNPSTGSFTVPLPENARQIEIYNSLGQVYLRKSVSGAEHQTLHIHEDGLYFIHVITAESRFTYKIVITS